MNVSKYVDRKLDKTTITFNELFPSIINIPKVEKQSALPFGRRVSSRWLVVEDNMPSRSDRPLTDLNAELWDFLDVKKPV